MLTSHYMDEVEALCDRICLLKDGKEVITGTVENIIKESPYDTLEEAISGSWARRCKDEKISYNVKDRKAVSLYVGLTAFFFFRWPCLWEWPCLLDDCRE